MDYTDLEEIVNRLEDAFYSLDAVERLCNKEDEDCKIIVNSINELIKSHNILRDRLKENIE